MRITDAAFVKSVTAINQRKDIVEPEVCFVGRSNVGKSSLLNSLSMRKVARTGSTPGATRAINLYRVKYEQQGTKRQAIFSDFPGFGYSKVARTVYQNWQGMIETYVIGNRMIRLVLWAFDVRRDFDELDHMLLEWLRQHGLPFSVVLTKADKESRNRCLLKKQGVHDIIGREPVLVYSSKDGTGRAELLVHIARCLD
jgi:GTP-binding protein